jgi:hypothetical protein
MLRTNGGAGDYFKVSDEPPTAPREWKSSNNRTATTVFGSICLTVLIAATFARTRQKKKQKSIAN